MKGQVFMKNKIITLLENVKIKSPLVHNITNYVTVNDCANAILAIGASPVMADSIMEASDITSVSSSLVINIGTLNECTVESMIASGKTANKLGIPVIFDPVGSGASPFRNHTVNKILGQVHVSVLKGNLSEIAFIAGIDSKTKGVDASLESLNYNSEEIATEVADRYECITAITGNIDVITNGRQTVKIMNGHQMLSQITGTGCMTTALIGAFAGATDNDYFTAAVAGIASMGIAGELAYAESGASGTGSFRISTIDALSLLNSNIIGEMLKIEQK